MGWDDLNHIEKHKQIEDSLRDSTWWAFEQLGIASNHLWHEILSSLGLSHFHKRSPEAEAVLHEKAAEYLKEQS